MTQLTENVRYRIVALKAKEFPWEYRAIPEKLLALFEGDPTRALPLPRISSIEKEVHGT